MQAFDRIAMVADTEGVKSYHRCKVWQIGWAKSHTKLSRRVQCIDCGTWAERTPNMNMIAVPPFQALASKRE